MSKVVSYTTTSGSEPQEINKDRIMEVSRDEGKAEKLP